MAAVFAALGTALFWLCCILGILLAVVAVLLLLLLFVPTFVQLRYEDEAFSLVLGVLGLRIHLYPRVYFLWDKYKNETPEQTAARLAEKEAKKAAQKAKKDAEKAAQKSKKLDQKTAGRAGKLTLDIIVTLVRAAGMVAKLILGALRIEQIRLFLPVHTEDAAKTVILYGKINAWFYASTAILNNFLYLDFEEIQITPVFEENFERTAYFSCKVSAQLFIMVVVAVRLFQALRHEKELLALFRRAKPRSTTQKTS